MTKQDEREQEIREQVNAGNMLFPPAQRRLRGIPSPQGADEMSDTKQQCPQCEKWKEVSGLNTPEELDKIMDNVLAKNLAPIRPLLDALADSPVEGSGEPTSSAQVNRRTRVARLTDSGAYYSFNDGMTWHPNRRRAVAHSPAAAGCGAREWYENWLATRPHRDLTTSYGVIGLIAAYADHCTAQLRQQVDDLRRQRDLEWDSRKRAQSELTAERTRREAAERELKELRKKYNHAVQCVDRRCSVCNMDARSAALRGKEGQQ